MISKVELPIFNNNGVRYLIETDFALEYIKSVGKLLKFTLIVELFTLNDLIDLVNFQRMQPTINSKRNIFKEMYKITNAKCVKLVLRICICTLLLSTLDQTHVKLPLEQRIMLVHQYYRPDNGNDNSLLVGCWFYCTK